MSKKSVHCKNFREKLLQFAVWLIITHHCSRQAIFMVGVATVKNKYIAGKAEICKNRIHNDHAGMPSKYQVNILPLFESRFCHCHKKSTTNVLHKTMYHLNEWPICSENQLTNQPILFNNNNNNNKKKDF